MSRHYVALLPLLVALGGCAETDSTARENRPAADPSPESTSSTRIELRINPLVDLYFFVRAQSADTESEPEPGFESAVEAARGIQRQLGSFGGWGALDSQVLALPEVGELATWFSGLPEPYEHRGRSLSLRDDAVRLAEALAERMPSFLDERWPARKAELEARAAFLDEAYLPRHQEALAMMLESLGIPDPGVTVPMFLVTQANQPGAMTYYLRGGASASILAVTTLRTNELLMETLLHEATHTLDLASSKEGTGAFEVLRTLLEERGFSSRDRAYHDIPHTLMFVQAEETMRRIYDPDHLAYGEATDLYERSGAMATVEREIWPRHLDGELSLEEALRRIIETLDPQPGGN